VRQQPPILGVVSDLDGTLLGSDGTFSPATTHVVDRLHREGIPFIVATARTPRAMRKVAGHQRLGRVVCANGAIVWDATRDEILAQTCFDPAHLSGSLGRLRAALPDAGVALLSAHAMFLDDAFRALRHSVPVDAQRLSDVDGVLASHRIVMVAVRHPRLPAERLLPPTSQAFVGTGIASFAGPSVVDIAPADTTKAVTAAREMATLSCPADATVVFGDMPNDLPLLAWAGWACAVANGHRTVLAAADEIVPSNDEDGVARTVRRLVELEARLSP
jgi:Cof subfamily protein (haloacid dehalogenase superfamily)